MNEPIRPRTGDERLLRGRPADDVVRPGRSVFDDGLDDDYDEEDDFDDDYDDEEEDDDAVELPHWTEPPSGQAAATKRGDADAWTTLTGSQPRWRESAADYDDAPESAGTAADADYDSDAAAEEFFEFDDEGNADFQRFIKDESVTLEDDDDDIAPIPISGPAAAGGAARSGAGGARGAAKKSGGPRKEARPAPRRRNDMRARVITGAVLGVLAIAAFVSGPAATVGLTSIVLGLCVIEMSNALRRAGYQPATLLAIVAAVGAPVAVYQRGVDGLLVIVAVSTAFSLLWFLAKAGDESPVLNAGVTMFTITYIGILGSYGALILRVFGKHGIGMILAAVLGTVGHDIGALLVGRSAGKTKLTSVSPGKTREGLFGGMLTAIIVVVVVVGMFKIAPFGDVPSDRHGIWNGGMPQAAWLGLAIAVAAPLGDLVESLIKRDLGVKDMGNILKGHGGVLDRFDALLFTLPTTYYIARFVIL